MEDAETLAQTLPTGASAVVILFEHTWTRRLTDAVRRAAGVLFSGGIIAPTRVELLESTPLSSPVAPAPLKQPKQRADAQTTLPTTRRRRASPLQQTRQTRQMTPRASTSLPSTHQEGDRHA